MVGQDPQQDAERPQRVGRARRLAAVGEVLGAGPSRGEGVGGELQFALGKVLALESTPSLLSCSRIYPIIIVGLIALPPVPSRRFMPSGLKIRSPPRIRTSGTPPSPTAPR